VCSGCQIPLVSSQEALAIPVVAAWEGSERKHLEQILAALESAGIPSSCKESLETKPASWFLMLAKFTIFSAFVKRRPLIHFAVSVLKADLPRAREILGQLDEARQREYKA